MHILNWKNMTFSKSYQSTWRIYSRYLLPNLSKLRNLILSMDIWRPRLASPERSFTFTKTACWSYEQFLDISPKKVVLAMCAQQSYNTPTIQWALDISEVDGLMKPCCRHNNCNIWPVTYIDGWRNAWAVSRIITALRTSATSTSSPPVALLNLLRRTFWVLSQNFDRKTLYLFDNRALL